MTHWITRLWPGLPALWWRGDVLALVPAVAFACLLNLALLLSVSPLASGAAARFAGILCWAGVLFSMAVGYLRSVDVVAATCPTRFEPSADDRHEAAGSDAEAVRSGEATALFQRAQREYLRGHWFEAEELLARVMSLSRGRDADALLMLAGVCARTDRFAEAREHLDTLQSPAFAGKWDLEVELEYRRLDLLEQAQSRSSEQTRSQDASPASPGHETSAAESASKQRDEEEGEEGEPPQRSAA